MTSLRQTTRRSGSPQQCRILGERSQSRRGRTGQPGQPVWGTPPAGEEVPLARRVIDAWLASGSLARSLLRLFDHLLPSTTTAAGGLGLKGIANEPAEKQAEAHGNIHPATRGYILLNLDCLPAGSICRSVPWMEQYAVHAPGVAKYSAAETVLENPCGLGELGLTGPLLAVGRVNYPP